ncbi:AAA family ATPase [Sphingomonas flavalba]|uniref:AAA family ATPase n=1 Tax=Sphingomonas flavalba TaxID=2559804 RepID=UPI0039E0154D
MKLHQLVATNFMPYRETITVDFPTEDHRNVMIVLGDNMRGKTSLMNALRWGFYGRAVGRHSRPIALHDIVNKDGARVDDWRVEVFLKFEANGHDYELRRTADRRAHVATPSRTEDFIVAPHLSKDGIVIAGDQVEAEINLVAPEQVSRFFLFDGELLGEYEELLIEGSEQGRQIKEAIEQVLGVPALTNGRAELGAMLKAATKKQSQEMAHIAGLERSAENMAKLTARLDSQDADLMKLQEKLAQTRSERSVLEDELEQAATILALKATLDAAKEAATGADTTLKRKRGERHSLLGLAWKDLLDAKLEVKRTILRQRQAKSTETLRARLKLEEAIKSVQKALDTRACPTCKQPFPEQERAALGAQLGQFEVDLANLDDAASGIDSVASELAILDDIKGVRARERLVEIDKDIRAAEVALQKAENDIERTEEKIAGHDTAELSRKRVLHQEKLKEEGRLTESIKTVERDIAKTNEELAVARKSIEGLAGARSKRSTVKVGIIGEIEACFAASVERLRDKLREQVQTLASQSFKEMTTQKSYRGLEINDNYGLSIIDSTGRPVSIRSAGAEQVVALSLIDGLNRTGRAIGPVVMDTPFGRLDPKHRDNILKYLPTVTSQFVLLVHGGEIRPDTDLASIKSRIGAAYTITEVSETQSKIERTAL